MPLARLRATPDETRERILAVAEEQFRRVGYAKTAVADIAAELGMSPANVYRFFPSKAAINEAICDRCLAEAQDLIDAVAAGPGSASERIERLVLELHRYNKSRLTAERRIHDMVAVAMEQNWPSIERHFAHILAVLTRLVEEGVQAGEFPVQDAGLAALTFKNTLASVMHPALIAACGHDELENQAIRIARFGVAALKAAPALPAPRGVAFPMISSLLPKI
jgi:AcrR family transcriptional regulator